MIANFGSQQRLLLYSNLLVKYDAVVVLIARVAFSILFELFVLFAWIVASIDSNHEDEKQDY